MINNGVIIIWAGLETHHTVKSYESIDGVIIAKSSTGNFNVDSNSTNIKIYAPGGDKKNNNCVNEWYGVTSNIKEYYKNQCEEGTSFSAPFIAGIAKYLLDRGYTIKDVQEYFRNYDYDRLK